MNENIAADTDVEPNPGVENVQVTDDSVENEAAEADPDAVVGEIDVYFSPSIDPAATQVVLPFLDIFHSHMRIVFICSSFWFDVELCSNDAMLFLSPSYICFNIRIFLIWIIDAKRYAQLSLYLLMVIGIGNVYFR